MQRYCFVVMPFRSDLDGIYEMIKQAAQQNGIEARRADELNRAGFVMFQVREQIEGAAVVVSDLTGRNANVFYETAIAHMVKDPHQVVLLAQSDADVPTDLRPLRYLSYEDTAAGGQELKRRLAAFIKEALSGVSGPLLESIEGREERTRRIVADCDALMKTPDDSDSSLAIRFEGGLSVLAISKEATTDASLSNDRRLLQEERQRTVDLIKKGAVFKAMIAPRSAKAHDPEFTQHFGSRIDNLLAVLESNRDDIPMDRLEIALIEPYYVRNTLMLGDFVLYDGIKAAMGGGFDLTIRLTDKAQIAARVRAYDSLFDDASRYTLKVYGTGPDDRNLKAAVIRGLRALREELIPKQ
jgi:hypothetical protein